ncbi:MAG TPA: decaprenyl-phosphate phosphoribosyltransferase [Marmoricola sp.]|nr:decaprenyl-phosphate phosphoribosyltransferase [Marmoricola sp.]
MSLIVAVVQAMRPRQWIKNVLVLAAPLAAGDLFRWSVASPALVAFVAFCLASSAVYLVNDCADLEADRLHPRKRMRPIAAGRVAVSTALAVAFVLSVCAVLLGLLTGWQLAAVLLGYLAMQLAYALRLKHEPVVDISIVAGGFLLRAVAGGVAAGLPISQWFLLVAGFGSLFMVSGKRYSELHTLGSEAGTRRSLVRYTPSYLRFVSGVAAGATLMSYSLWAFENVPAEGIPWHTISIAPFLIGMLRYGVDVDAGTAAEPEDIVFGDRVLQGVALCWLVVVWLGVRGA